MKGNSPSAVQRLRFSKMTRLIDVLRLLRWLLAAANAFQVGRRVRWLVIPRPFSSFVYPQIK
jgi:hypothetical protein